MITKRLHAQHCIGYWKWLKYNSKNNNYNSNDWLKCAHVRGSIWMAKNKTFLKKEQQSNENCIGDASQQFGLILSFSHIQWDFTNMLVGFVILLRYKCMWISILLSSECHCCAFLSLSISVLLSYFLSIFLFRFCLIVFCCLAKL